MRLWFIQILLYSPTLIFSQDDPCKFTNSGGIEKFDKGESKKDDFFGYREINLMISALNAGNKNCKWNAQTSFKQILNLQKKLLNINIEIFDENKIENNVNHEISVSNDLLKLELEVYASSTDNLKSIRTGMMVQTQKFPHYRENTDTAGAKPILVRQTTAFSPTILYPAFEWVLDGEKGYRVDFGLVGMKITRRSPRDEALPNVEKNFFVKGGSRVQLMVDKKLSKKFKWEHYAFVFYSFGRKTLPEIELRNTFSFIAGEHLKAGLLTRYIYMNDRWPPGELSGEISLGFLWD